MTTIKTLDLAAQLAACERSAASPNTRQLLLPEVRTWSELFEDWTPWRTVYELDLPEDLAGTDYATVKRWALGEHAATMRIKGASLGVAPDQTSASVTVTHEAPKGWERQWTGTDCNMVTGRRYQAAMKLSPFVSVRGGRSVYAKARREVRELVQADSLFIAHDTMGFKITIRENGTALVTCDHGAIIGGRWVAIIPVHALPNFIAC